MAKFWKFCLLGGSMMWFLHWQKSQSFMHSLGLAECRVSGLDWWNSTTWLTVLRTTASWLSRKHCSSSLVKTKIAQDLHRGRWMKKGSCTQYAQRFTCWNIRDLAEFVYLTLTLNSWTIVSETAVWVCLWSSSAAPGYSTLQITLDIFNAIWMRIW